MCGIAGVLHADRSQPVDPLVLQRMCDSLAHRGPDAAGCWRADGIGLAHRRLSIIDLAGGDQPIGNEDGSVQVIFNGEIYNHPALRRLLEARGHRFRTRSDTEVIVHLYEDEQEQAVRRLRGMFAFALWDARRRRLVLARDRVGIKPLYVYRDADKLLFASELKAILAYPGLRRVLDVEALESYLTYGMVVGPRSIFSGIEKLPPAHVLVVGPSQLDRPPRRYWSLSFDPEADRSEAEWEEAIRAKVAETVRAHLIADVPVGAFLSGGVDSSLIVAAAAQAGAAPLQTFSVGFADEAISELPFAKRVAEQFQTAHTELLATPDAVSLLDRLVYHYDEPFADSSAIPTFLISEAARRHVKVILSGDGGDEAFGGYARYRGDLRESRLRRCLPRSVRRRVLGPLADAWPGADWLPRPLRAKTLLTNLSLDPAAAYANSLALCRAPYPRGLMAPDLVSRLNGHSPGAPIQQGYCAAGTIDPVAGMIASDIAVRLPDDYLVKVDRASMAHGLEVRPPLLDHELLELAARIPSSLKVRSGVTKWILKRAYRNVLPRSTTRRPKRGFEIPLDVWLQGPLAPAFETSVLSPRAPVAALIRQEAARQIFDAHRAGWRRCGALLWSLLVLARWTERHMARV